MEDIVLPTIFKMQIVQGKRLNVTYSKGYNLAWAAIYTAQSHNDLQDGLMTDYM